jgi:hypothetical protein
MRACGNLWAGAGGSAAGLTPRERHDTVTGTAGTGTACAPAPAHDGVFSLLFFFSFLLLLLLRIGVGLGWAGLSVSARERAAGSPDGWTDGLAGVASRQTEPEPPVVLVCFVWA